MRYACEKLYFLIYHMCTVLYSAQWVKLCCEITLPVYFKGENFGKLSKYSITFQCINNVTLDGKPW